MNEYEMKNSTFSKVVIYMGLPTMAAQLVTILYGMIDRMYIGQIPEYGIWALAGVGLSFPITNIVTAFAFLSGTGGASLATVWMGKNNKAKAEKILGGSFFLTLFFSLLTTVLFLLLLHPVLSIYGTNQEVLTYAKQYLTIVLSGTIFSLISTGMIGFISCQGKTKLSMKIIITSALSNLILDYLFIFVLGFGIKGAAAATVIAQAISAIWIVIYLASPFSIIRLKMENIQPNIKYIKKILALGSGQFLMRITQSLMNIVINKQLISFGGDVYASVQSILICINDFLWIPGNGCSNGCGPVIGWCYGAQLFDRVRMLCKKMVLFSLLTTAGLASMIYVLRRPIIEMFTSNSQVIEIAMKVFPIFILPFFFFGIQLSVQVCFLSLGQAKVSAFIATVRKMVILIPFALVFPYFFGVMGVYYAQALADFLSVTLCMTLFCILFPKINTKEYLRKL